MYYYVIAGHDSVRILVDENGNITDTYSYDTYGELTDRSGTTADSYQRRLSDPVSLHKYLYANANPVMYADPSGYMAAEIISTSAAIAIIGTLLADAFMSGCIAAGFAAAAILGASLRSVAVMVAI